MKRIEVSEFLKSDRTLIDVRSQGEFEESHILEAINIPLLNNEERIQVGTAYKQVGKEAAIEIGFQLVNPRKDEILENLMQTIGNKPIKLYCARGGMRSQLMANYFTENGYDVVVLEGGYKAYRNHVLSQISNYTNLIVLSGYTGSGKTEILSELRGLGAQVIDLEFLANHKGSVFGALGNSKQPKSAEFHNLIFNELSKFDYSTPIWVENESFRIGNIYLPKELWLNMKNSPGIELYIPFNDRVEFTKKQYGNFNAEDVSRCINYLRKRLGDEKTNQLLCLVRENDADEIIESLLLYYDKAYEFGREKRKCHNYVKLSFESMDIKKIAEYLYENQNGYSLQIS
ncbi:MAG: tRNA 2-selenouridine(34) synthase MnmH [Bacteroidia bacterium]